MTEPATAVPLRILLAGDHDEDCLSSIGRLLQLLGHDVHTAGTSDDAMAHAGRHPRAAEYDVLISAVTLPDGNGNGLMRELRALYRRPVPGVALGGDGVAARDSSSGGFLRHLAHPVSFRDLVLAVEEVLAPVLQLEPDQGRPRWRRPGGAHRVRELKSIQALLLKCIALPSTTDAQRRRWGRELAAAGRALVALQTATAHGAIIAPSAA